MPAHRIPRAYQGAAQAVPNGVTGGQVVAAVDAPEVVVFLIGMRVNRWRRVRSWWPVFAAMPRMLAELKQADAGLLNAHTLWSGRTFVVVQYWRSAEELGAYARNPSLQHAPAWGAFNKSVASTGDVGIFHETYVVPRERIESLYANIAPLGLAKAHGSVPRSERGRATQAHRRLNTTQPEYLIQD